MDLVAPPRWRPSRAGILNVYQYEDETLHFADGRLLLRGVNGSGKSTAMNMLLPFLLEADTRRIDAAGVQTGVLKSWMLADTEETQRTGYLWIEFARPDGDAPGGVRHHTMGCGIRASRSTDRVTTWWFSTPRRARIEFSLTAQLVPLAVETLRAELGPEAVFSTPTEYRAEISRRFFGGADPSGYLALLHQVRNPRVGERIDADLPQRLQEALPPVSENAVADAAQPLEDLEDHRRNVTALEQTDRALGSVLDTYRQYARRVVGSAADRAAGSVSTAQSALQLRGRARTAADEAAAALQRLAAQIRDLEGKHGTVTAELTGLMSSPAYHNLQALMKSRDHVASLEDHAGTLTSQRDGARRRVEKAAVRIAAQRIRVDADLTRVGASLIEAARHGRAAAARLPLPDPPVLRARTLGAGDVEGPIDDADLLSAIDLRPADDAVRARREQVKRIRDVLGAAETASSNADDARTEAVHAAEVAEREQTEATAARKEADEAGEQHRSAVLAWADRLAEHIAAVPTATRDGPPSWLAKPLRPDPGGDELRAVARARVTAAKAAAVEPESALEAALAAAAVRVDTAEQVAEQLAAEVAAVHDAAELPLPRAGWQDAEPADSALFASLVDFADDVNSQRRAGLEAAIEASGLLTASVRPDGSVFAHTGELMVVAGEPVVPNLASVLVPALPDDSAMDVTAVARVLAHVGLGIGSAAALWVTDDGQFCAGSLRGRHTKVAPEHVGAGARAAARERRLAVLQAALTDAEELLRAERSTHQAVAEHRTGLRKLTDQIPATDAVDYAAATAVAAAGVARRAAEQAAQLRSAAVKAERVAEQAWALAQTAAAEAALPLDAAALDDVAAAVEEAAGVLRQLPGHVSTARRSLSDWADAVESWETESADFHGTASAAAEAITTAEYSRTELTAVEAALGEEPEQVATQVDEATRRRNRLAKDLGEARKSHTDAIGDAATARAEACAAEEVATGAERDCQVERTGLLAVCATAGLLAAASSGTPDHARKADDALPTVPDSVDGTSRLVSAVRELVPKPEREVGEDALDRSLRAIRDSLGAGWDAEARRSTDGAPVAVEVSGPYGRRALPDATVQVGIDLRRARGLLTAKQDQALRNLLRGRIAREVAAALFEARELVDGINSTLGKITTGQGIGVRLQWRTRGDLDPATATALRLLGKDPDARTAEEEAAVRAAVAGLVDDARAADPEATYRDVISEVLDYRRWHELRIYLRRPGRSDELLSRRTRLSEGEKKLVTYLPMAAAASVSAGAHDPHSAGAPRLILLDDAFAKVSEDNHAGLFGLLVSLDLDFVITSERLFGTHATVPELAITEVLRDADLRTIALVHYHWDGRQRTPLTGTASGAGG